MNRILNIIVELFNSYFGAAVDLLLYPFRGLDPVWGLLWLSVLSGVILLFVYGKISNQQGLKAIKRRIAAFLLEAVIYRRDLRVSLASQGRMFLAGGRYFLYALFPILILMLPCILLLAQLNIRYGVRPLVVGEETLLEVELKPGSDLKDFKLEPVNGLKLTPPVREPEVGLVTWRLKALAAGNYQLNFTLAGEALASKDLHTLQAPGAKKVAPLRTQSSLWGLLYPGEPLLPAAGLISNISLAYPELSLNFLGLDWNWIVFFLIFSILAGLVASKFLHIEI